VQRWKELEFKTEVKSYVAYPGTWKIHCKSEKLQQCEASRRRLLLTEEGRSAAEEVLELRHSQPREWYKEQVWLLKHGEISANPMLPWDPGNEDSRLTGYITFSAACYR
jgi:site-specific recombinase XerC